MKYYGITLLLFLLGIHPLKAQVVTITPQDAAKKIVKKRTVVLDVRTKKEFAEGHLPNAINIDILDSAAFIQQIQSLKKRKQYIVYCRSGKRSMKASDILASNQFKHIFNMEGGVLAWTQELKSEH